MINLSIKVELYMGRKVDFPQEVLLRDNGEGEGPFISEWNVTEKPQPSLDQLNAFEDAAVKVDYNNRIRGQRVIGYGSIGDQLDKLWHAMDTGEIGKVASFYNAIKEVKDKYPKKL